MRPGLFLVVCAYLIIDGEICAEEYHLGCWDGTNSTQYSGPVSWTNNGRLCQSWSSQEPHGHFHVKDSMFPVDGSVAKAGNKCRDPDGTGIPWCYTTNKDVQWEYCDVPICNIDCYYPNSPQRYQGQVSRTEDGILCQAWSEQTPHKHTKFTQNSSFPNDGSILAANNYCRRFGRRSGRLWCFTVSPFQRWANCAVPQC